MKVEDSKESSVLIMDDVEMEVVGERGGRGSSEVSGSVASSRSSSVEPVR